MVISCGKNMRRLIIRWKSISNRRIRSSSNGRPFCSSANNHRKNSSSSSNGSSMSSYDEQYKALNNLDFMKAARILFSDPPKKNKFGLDFHLVQLFFVCLPSLAVYLVAQFARSEMRKMDAELERKKQAEFEAQAKEMELKAAEEKALVACNPELLEVKERLEKLEVTVKEIVVESKKQLAVQVEPGNTQNESVGNSSKQRGNVSGDLKISGPASATHASDGNQNDNGK